MKTSRRSTSAPSQIRSAGESDREVHHRRILRRNEPAALYKGLIQQFEEKYELEDIASVAMETGTD